MAYPFPTLAYDDHLQKPTLTIHMAALFSFEQQQLTLPCKISLFYCVFLFVVVSAVLKPIATSNKYPIPNGQCTVFCFKNKQMIRPMNVWTIAVFLDYLNVTLILLLTAPLLFLICWLWKWRLQILTKKEMILFLFSAT